MKPCAVVDTNVVISGVITKNTSSPTKQLLNSIDCGKIVPLINQDILFEYEDVLTRDKFHLTRSEVDEIMNLFRLRGEVSEPVDSCVVMADADDIVFYQTYLSYEDAYLVTGNLRHFPTERRIVLPADMMQILRQLNNAASVLSDPGVQYISESKRMALEKAWATIEGIREKSARNGVGDMTMDEINEEIRLCRANRRLVCPVQMRAN